MRDYQRANAPKVNARRRARYVQKPNIISLIDTPSEEWRAIVGYEGWYEVSDLGRVRRIRSCAAARPGGILKTTVRKSGYLGVGLTRNGRTSSKEVHRLVGMAFIGPPPTPEHEVNHKDANKGNDRADNLEWVTPLENVRHAIKLGHRK